MGGIFRAALAFAFAVSPLAVHAQVQPDWAQIETVTVKGEPGPAVWHLTRGASEVWILGTAGPLPKGLEWNRQYVSELFDGARAVLFPAKADVNLVDVGWFLVWHGGELRLPHGQTLEAALPDDLRARFTAARDAVGGDDRDYSTDIPIRAAIRLQQDMVTKADLEPREPRRTIEDLADRSHAHTGPVTYFEAMDAVRDILKLSPEQQRACLSQAVDDVSFALVHADRAARAWAVGDIKSLKANFGESRLYNCVSQAVSAIGDIDARNSAATVAAIDAALNQPGKTVVVIGVGPLLRKGGVLEQLKARGVAIEGPAE
jgi:uncharacterized protein YbaP (TraB family)